MTRPAEDVARVRELAGYGLNYSQIARRTGVSDGAIRAWLRPESLRAATPICPACGHDPHDFERLPEHAYSYLLGMYLGDGIVVRVGRCFALRVFMDSRYPNIIAEVAEAMRAVNPRGVASVYPHPRHNVATIVSYSKAWPCLLPQHGPGRKHERKIELESWQQATRGSAAGAAGSRAAAFRWVPGDEPRLRQQDGLRLPALPLHQVSKDIQGIFCRALDRLGIAYGFSRWGKDVSIARRESVARLDSFVGRKS